MVQYVDFRSELDFEAVFPYLPAPIHIAEEHRIALIPGPYGMNDFRPGQQKGALRLIHDSFAAMVEISHFPAIKNRAVGKQKRQPQKTYQDIPVRWKAPARGLNAAVFISKLWSKNANVRLAPHVADESLQRIAGHFRIRIEEKHEFCADEIESLIDGGRKKFVRMIEYELHVSEVVRVCMKSAKNIRSRIEGSVIDDDQLYVETSCSAFKRAQAGKDLRCIVIRDQDNAANKLLFIR